MAVFKRWATGLIGFPIIAVAITLATPQVIDVIVALIASFGVYEFFSIFKKKEIKPIIWIGYLCSFSLIFIHIVPYEYLKIFYSCIGLISILIALIQMIVTNLKTNIIDVAVTILGIIYIVGFTAFISFVRNMENGVYYIWYLYVVAWGTDIFAYLIGRTLGKHKLSPISPKKTIEGAIGGVVGCIFIMCLVTFIFNKYMGLNINYMYIILVAFTTSIISQIGDLVASGAKRYAEIKDFGDILPGHGGILDRCDSLVFVAPFLYILLVLIGG